jgi:iron uptake system EfeUOB component EfeO/EfeM
MCPEKKHSWWTSQQQKMTQIFKEGDTQQTKITKQNNKTKLTPTTKTTKQRPKTKNKKT